MSQLVTAHARQNPSSLADALNSFLSSEENSTRARYLRMVNQLQVTSEAGLTKIEFTLADNLKPENKKSLYPKVGRALKAFLTSLATGEVPAPQRMQNFIRNRCAFERTVRGRLSAVLDRPDLIQDKNWIFNYYLITDPSSGYNNLVVAITPQAANLHASKLQNEIKSFAKRLGVNAVIVNPRKQVKLEAGNIDLKKQAFKFGNNQFSKLAVNNYFVRVDDRLPLLTIDNDNTKRMEDAIYVKHLSKHISYCSVYYPLKMAGAKVSLRPDEAVIAIGVEFLLNRKSGAIFEPRLHLAEVQSKARLTYDALDRHWAKIGRLPEIKKNLRSDMLVRNLRQSFEAAVCWRTANKASNESVINFGRAHPGHLIVQSLMEMSQVAIGQFLATKGVPFIEIVETQLSLAEELKPKAEAAKRINFGQSSSPETTLRGTAKIELAAIIDQVKLMQNSTQYKIIGADVKTERVIRAPIKSGKAAEANQRQILSVLSTDTFEPLTIGCLGLVCVESNR